MREIKFRFWVNEMGDYIEETDSYSPLMIYGNEYAFDQYMPINDLLNSSGHIAMQFTGLKDKNGVDIYEGDILNVGENLKAKIIYIGENCDDYGDETNCAFHAEIFLHNKIIPIDGYFKKNCKVIGNIYENPELLK